MFGTYGIAGGADNGVLADGPTATTARLDVAVSSNTVSGTTGSGIRFLANGAGSLNARVTANVVATPGDQKGQYGGSAAAPQSSPCRPRSCPRTRTR
ncbi:MAG TPA: hypothetical protein VES95_09980 [Dermatophilaceae bacterium]|nr:hypothetical protein [Dermatophilaceae bacterium]